MKFFIITIASMSSLAFGQDEQGGFIQVVMQILDLTAQLVMGVCVVATIISRLTPPTSDDEKVSKIVSQIRKVLSHLPTFGINPSTRELEEALARLEEKN